MRPFPERDVLPQLRKMGLLEALRRGELLAAWAPDLRALRSAPELGTEDDEEGSRMTVSTSHWPEKVSRFVLKLPTPTEEGAILFRTAEGEEIDVGMAVWGKIEIEVAQLEAEGLQISPITAKLPVLLEIRA